MNELSLFEQGNFDREIYNEQRYNLQSDNYNIVVQAYCAFLALSEIGFDIQLEIKQDADKPYFNVIIWGRNLSESKFDFEDAMISGLIGALHITSERSDLGEKIISEEDKVNQIIPLEDLQTTALKYVQQITENPDINDIFTGFCSAGRGRNDVKNLIDNLFLYGAEVDFNSLGEFISKPYLSLLYRSINPDKQREELDEFNKMSIADILEKYPYLNIERLSNDEYRNSDEGKKLESALKLILGRNNLYVYQNKSNSSSPSYDKNRQIELIPAIPLSRFPIIEALFVDELILAENPKRRHTLDLDLAYSTDSAAVHNALLQTLSTRLYNRAPSGSDYSSPFERKLPVINRLLMHALDPDNNDELKRLLFSDCSFLLNAFSPESENLKEILSTLINKFELRTLKSILIDIVSKCLYIGNVDISSGALKMLNAWLNYSQSDSIIDNNSSLDFIPDRTEFLIAILESMRYLNVESDLNIVVDSFQQILSGSSSLFHSALTAKLDLIEETRKYESSLVLGNVKQGNMPDVEFAELSIQVKAILSQKEAIAEEQLLRLVKELVLMILDSKNNLNLDTSRVLKYLAGYIDFFKNEKLSENYKWFIEVTSGTSNSNTSKVLELSANLSSRFLQVKLESLDKVMQVVLDIYNNTLGDPENIKTLPTENDVYSLRYANDLILRYDFWLFLNASSYEIEKLFRYFEVIKEILLKNSSEEVNADNKNTYFYLFSFGKDYNKLIDIYNSYVLMNQVRTFPHIYMKWVLTEIKSLISKLRKDLPYKRRTAADFNFCNIVTSIIRENEIVVQENYDETFDPINDGNLDILLSRMYYLLNDSKDSFDFSAFATLEYITKMMPSRLREAMILKYKKTPFSHYLESMSVGKQVK